MYITFFNLFKANQHHQLYYVHAAHIVHIFFSGRCTEDMHILSARAYTTVIVYMLCQHFQASAIIIVAFLMASALHRYLTIILSFSVSFTSLLNILLQW
jgi:hypothetical protein